MMSDILQGLSPTSSEVYPSALDVIYRWEPYKYATEPVNFYLEAYRELGVTALETIVDIGCSNGQGIVDIKQHAAHLGSIIGVEPSEGSRRSSIDKTSEFGGNVSIIGGKCEQLPFADNSVDVELMEFALYHAKPPESGLAEIIRTTKPGGKVALATSGKGNKSEHREFEEVLAEELGTNAAPRMAAAYDYDVARQSTPPQLKRLAIIPQVCEMHIPEGGIPDYLRSLGTMRRFMLHKIPGKYPSLHAWERGVEKKVVPKIRAQIEEKGYFTDYIERYLFLYQKHAA